ncbi:Transcription factor 25 [Mortierella polycephala]|uniref:Transcription factor 25 n=1 Tax=Mortierella polycephala TaxID=41804 RepID=A0A9P6U194_9FUNG|nr:Transcription factor 25 [Mortierella polycephala]
MSSRAMKKLLRDSNGPSLKEKEHKYATKDHKLEGDDPDHREEEEEDDEEDYVVQRPPARNLFALLNEDDQEDHDTSEDEEYEEVATVTVPAPSSSKKKKNKKKKSVGAAAANPFDALKEDDDRVIRTTTSTSPVAETLEEPSPASTKSKSKSKKKKKGKATAKSVEDMSVEEFERSLQQMNQQLGSISTAGGSSGNQDLTPLKQLLAVDTRFLDADAEMKKMFGARVVNSEIRDRRYAKVAKKALLAQPRGTWPVRKASGLSMEIVETDEKEHVTTFKIVHSDYYQRTQLKFLAAVASYDPGNLVALLRESPFHIDSLLQLSEVSKHNGDNALAGEFIEQALYAFEKSFHSLFNIASGSVRLSFMEVENRSFFLAIHRHIQFLGRRGCWRTAFEFNKLLLSLDPKHDELGALLSIDFYALKAQEYAYLLKLHEKLQQDHGLDRMPNFAFSVALAQFHQETSQDDSNHEKSSKTLQRAILMFPTAIPLLAEQGNFNVDAETAGEASFYPATDLPKVLDLYIHLFVSRNFALWKEPEVIVWLKSNVKSCVQSRFNNKSDQDVKDAQAMMSELSTAPPPKSSILSYSTDGTLESDAFPSSSSALGDPRAVSLRVCRHVLVSEFNALARYLPQDIVAATMHMHDPLPPAGSRNIYEERFEAQRSAGGLMGGARDAAQNILEGVVRRLLAGGGLPGPEAGEDGAGENGAGAEADGLQEAQLRRITEAVQMMRARHAANAQGGDLPGAFPGQQLPAGDAVVQVAAGQQENGGEPGQATRDADGAEELDTEASRNASMFQSLSEMMRLFGFGARDGADAMAPGALTQEETNEIVASVVNNLAHGGLGSEGGETDDDEEDEDYDPREDQPFGSDGDDGWEPYDPAAFE